MWESLSFPFFLYFKPRTGGIVAQDSGYLALHERPWHLAVRQWTLFATWAINLKKKKIKVNKKCLLRLSNNSIRIHLGINNKENSPLIQRPVSLCSLGCMGNKICDAVRWDTERNACPRGVLDTTCILILVLRLVQHQQPEQLLPLMMLLQSLTIRVLNRWTSYPTML